MVTDPITNDDYWQFLDVATGLCMSIADFSNYNGAPVVQLPCIGGDTRMLWKPFRSHV
jgi:hypothetical protein